MAPARGYISGFLGVVGGGVVAKVPPPNRGGPRAGTGGGQPKEKTVTLRCSGSRFAKFCWILQVALQGLVLCFFDVAKYYLLLYI